MGRDGTIVTSSARSHYPFFAEFGGLVPYNILSYTSVESRSGV
jgi:hypothetical protein